MTGGRAAGELAAEESVGLDSSDRSVPAARDLEPAPAGSFDGELGPPSTVCVSAASGMEDSAPGSSSRGGLWVKRQEASKGVGLALELYNQA